MQLRGVVQPDTARSGLWGLALVGAHRGRPLDSCAGRSRLPGDRSGGTPVEGGIYPIPHPYNFL